MGVDKVGIERLKLIHDTAQSHGVAKAANILNLSAHTIITYSKEYRRRIGEGIPEKEPDPKTEDIPNILLLDIETAPMVAYVWKLWDNNITPDFVLNDWFVLTWAAKWLHDDEIISRRLTARDVKDENDRRIIEDLWSLIDNSDIVIAHNGDRFDIPKINSRFVQHGLKPPRAYQRIDTLKVLKKKFGFSSNKLTYVNEILGLDVKIDTGGFDLWKRCMKGDESALIEMETYNRNDVKILEELYLKIRPWIPSHPNVGIYINSDATMCPACGSEDITKSGAYYTTVSEFDTYRCNACGAIGRMRTSNFSKYKRAGLGVSIAR